MVCVASKCLGDKDVGKFAAAVNPQITSNRGISCGESIRVMCGDNGNKAYCKHADFIDVKIVGECSPQQCPGENDMLLSKEAFAHIAEVQEKKIDVLWIHAHASPPSNHWFSLK